VLLSRKTLSYYYFFQNKEEFQCKYVDLSKYFLNIY
jgi:hypothetical protein